MLPPTKRPNQISAFDRQNLQTLYDSCTEVPGNFGVSTRWTIDIERNAKSEESIWRLLDGGYLEAPVVEAGGFLHVLGFAGPDFVRVTEKGANYLGKLLPTEHNPYPYGKPELPSEKTIRVQIVQPPEKHTHLAIHFLKKTWWIILLFATLVGKDIVLPAVAPKASAALSAWIDLHMRGTTRP